MAKGASAAHFIQNPFESWLKEPSKKSSQIRASASLQRKKEAAISSFTVVRAQTLSKIFARETGLNTLLLKARKVLVLRTSRASSRPSPVNP